MKRDFEIPRWASGNKPRAIVLNKQEALMSNVRVVIWLTWLMACKLMADLLPFPRERRTTGGV